MRKINGPYQQCGATALGMLSIIAVLGLGLYAIIRLTPVYLEYFEVVRAMEGIAKEAPTSVTEIRTSLDRRWNIEDIKSVDYKDIAIRKSSSGFEMTAEYRAEVPFIANVSLVAAFDKTVVVE
ncbi:MAG: DUF4845 domain-containing protein [Steroidobacteraceae bacterium]